MSVRVACRGSPARIRRPGDDCHRVKQAAVLGARAREGASRSPPANPAAGTRRMPRVGVPGEHPNVAPGVDRAAGAGDRRPDRPLRRSRYRIDFGARRRRMQGAGTLPCRGSPFRVRRPHARTAAFGGAAAGDDNRPLRTRLLMAAFAARSVTLAGPENAGPEDRCRQRPVFKQRQPGARRGNGCGTRTHGALCLSAADLAGDERDAPQKKGGSPPASLPAVSAARDRWRSPRVYCAAGARIVVGTEVNVEKGLKRSPSPDRLPLPVNCSTPIRLLVTGN